MKNLNLFLICFLSFTFISFAQEDTMEMSPEMKAWMEYMTPGETHKILAASDGEWKTKITYWMKPGEEPTITQGTTVNEMILGGRYQKSTHKGNMMGMPFEGINILAFDNARKEYYSIWIDNMSTGMMSSRGKFNEESGEVEMKGTYVDPMTSNEEPFRQVFKVLNDNHQVFEMFMYHDGKEFKNMVVEYTR